MWDLHSAAAFNGSLCVLFGSDRRLFVASLLPLLSPGFSAGFVLHSLSLQSLLLLLFVTAPSPPDDQVSSSH